MGMFRYNTPQSLRDLILWVGKATNREYDMALILEFRHESGPENGTLTHARPAIQEKGAVGYDLRTNALYFRVTTKKQLRIILGIIIKEFIRTRDLFSWIE